jgi:mono/diheme cytochrome c family protein
MSSMNFTAGVFVSRHPKSNREFGEDMTMKRILSVTLLLLTILAATACQEQEVSYPQLQMPAGLMQGQAQLAAGRELFMAKCATCHGKPSEGRSKRAAFFEPPAPDFTEVHYRQTDPAYLFWRIEVGKTVEPYRSQGSVMPTWGMHFSDEQIWQLVVYLKSRSQ